MFLFICDAPVGQLRIFFIIMQEDRKPLKRDLERKLLRPDSVRMKAILVPNPLNLARQKDSQRRGNTRKIGVERNYWKSNSSRRKQRNFKARGINQMLNYGFTELVKIVEEVEVVYGKLGPF